MLAAARISAASARVIQSAAAGIGRQSPFSDVDRDEAPESEREPEELELPESEPDDPEALEVPAEPEPDEPDELPESEPDELPESEPDELPESEPDEPADSDEPPPSVAGAAPLPCLSFASLEPSAAAAARVLLDPPRSFFAQPDPL